MIEFALRMKKMTFNKGEIIFERGDFSDFFYIIKKGSVYLTVHDREMIPFTKITEGYFGEFEFYRDRKRKYGAVAAEKLVVFTIKKHEFIDMFIEEVDQEFALRFRDHSYERAGRFIEYS